MMDVYDFYKPAHSEYPVVDGKLSQWAYLTSVDHCYERYKKKFASRHPDAAPVTLDHFDYFCFHAPYNKLVQKGFSRLAFIDALDNPSDPANAPVVPFLSMDRSVTLESRDVELALREVSKDRYSIIIIIIIIMIVIITFIIIIFIATFILRYARAVAPACGINQNVGNCYSGSVFVSLLSLLTEKGADLLGKRILMFSYGSGSAASLYTLVGTTPEGTNGNPLFTLDNIQRLTDMKSRLAGRTLCTVEEFVAALDLREIKYGKVMTNEEEDEFDNANR